jgi:hypothetical protein
MIGPALREHLLSNVLAAVEGAGEYDVDDLLPRVLGQLGQAAIRLVQEACIDGIVVEHVEHVDAAEQPS